MFLPVHEIVHAEGNLFNRFVLQLLTSVFFFPEVGWSKSVSSELRVELCRDHHQFDSSQRFER
jgi:hypothetical protein